MSYLENDHKTYILEGKLERKELIFLLGSVSGDSTPHSERNSGSCYRSPRFCEHC